MTQLRKFFEYGFSLHQQGKLVDAQAIYEQVIQIDDKNFDAIQLLGVIAAQNGDYERAAELIMRALKINPSDDACHNNLGNVLKNLKRYDAAINCYDKAIGLKPDYAEAHSNKGVVLHELKRYDAAINCYDKAIGLKPDYAEAYSNKGNALHELKRYDEAIVHYDKALSLKFDYHEAWVNKGVTLGQLKRYDEAIANYDKALSLKFDYYEAWANKGSALYELKRYDEAIANYESALRLKPDYAQVYSNIGNALHELKRYDEAIANYDRALSLKSDYAEAWSNKGNLLNELKRYDEAIANYESALRLKPDINWVLGDLLHAKMQICSWSDFDRYLEDISNKVLANEKVANPFPLLAMIDDPALHKKSSEIYIKNKYPSNSILGPIAKHLKKEKIRIGYFSADFRDHPVATLTVELFELHDKDRFEIIAFSFGFHDESAMRLRLSQAFNQFIDVSNMSDLEIAKLARDLKIDIAVDLGGFTAASRPGIFSFRAGPIQVIWLGYPGTIGSDFIDYIVADRIIIPELHQHFYTEKVAYLPNTYMPNDSKRLVSSKRPTRFECGLPENGFVFCCFNNAYKINSQTLDGWAKILFGVTQSVLWVSDINKQFKVNIKTEFERRGIDSGRIIFAQRMELMKDHLARHSLADLFLDTFPYNAHTTASDALWAGLPVLTLMGQSFASRVAASLLNAIGLPELIVNTAEEYEALAIDLALNPKKLEDAKLKLANNRLTSPLFNTPLFTKNIESAYIKMHERCHAGLEPDHIFIA